MIAVCLTNASSLKMLGFLLFARFAIFSYADDGILVYPTILQGRATATNVILRLNDAFTLNLTKSSVLANELLVATSSLKGNEIEKIETSALRKSLYHDTRHQSSLIVRLRGGAAQIEGIINNKLRIKPVPEGKRSLQGEMLHMIYQVEETKENVPNFVFADKGRFGQITPREGSNMENFVVEVHVISDSVHQKEFKTTEDLIAYFAVLLNGVNLRYVEMTAPRIEFMLVGITRSMDDIFANHMQAGVLDMDKTLNGLFDYYKAGNVPGKPDVVHLITGQDIARYENGALDKDYSGIAKPGPPCTKLAVSLSEDVATAYRGVFIMAHELGHVLGSPHDETPKCPWSEGFLMSYEDGGVKKFRLSPCSEDKIRSSLKNMPGDCTQIVAHKDYMSRYKYVPGQKVSRQRYCRRLMKKYTTEKIFYTNTPELTQRCKMKCCFSLNKNVDNCLVVLILDGMKCSKEKTCRRGVCGKYTWPEL